MSRLGPQLAITVWAVLVGVLLWRITGSTIDPPVWDAFSYYQKGFNFWTTVEAGHWPNPFNIEPTVRPPGVILLTHPFGLTENFAGFYFRSVYLPIVLLISAVYVAGFTRTLPWPGHVVLAAIALALAGMPMIYQFQPNEELASQLTWGMVDNFLAGIAAVALAATIRSVRTLSLIWAITAAAFGAFAFLVKPSGILVMALTGLSWVLLIANAVEWNIRAGLRKNPALRRFLALGLIGASIIFAITTFAAITSNYFSVANLAFAARVIEVLDRDFIAILNVALFKRLITISIGFVIPIIFVIGLTAAIMSRSQRGAAITAAFSLMLGIWFWIIETEVSEIRYFVPFMVMAVIATTPALINLSNQMPKAAVLASGFAAITPTLAITLLLLQPNPSLDAQRMWGINLSRHPYEAETKQAEAFLASERANGSDTLRFYLADITKPSSTIAAVVMNHQLAGRGLPAIRLDIPVTWQRASGYGFEEIERADFVAVEPYTDEAERAQVLSTKVVADFATERKIIRAWFTTLGTDDGVEIESETKVRILKIVDRSKLEAAWQRLENAHEWRAEFLKVNPRRWWSENDIGAWSTPGTLLPDQLTSQLRGSSENVMTWRAISMNTTDTSIEVRVLLRAATTNIETNDWYLFAHLIETDGKIVTATQTDLLPLTPPSLSEGNVYRSFSLSLPAPSSPAMTIGLGVFQGKDNKVHDTLITHSSRTDMDGARALITVPK
jgi:hypothetical protein